ncbi:hypothetical protein KUTeg_012323 [Tegillarca granosa]|uniref:Uncharacterized protein n=1 Tax=Tegillarca granosa TaxID=220873 RepID=A0ABQ9EZ85_TEGGR|nr:hypothetical protein KUTeg_012323 [Tegillarca granosa]
MDSRGKSVLLFLKINLGSSDSVISAIIYSVKWIHKINNLPNPCENGIVQNLLKSTKRVASKVTEKLKYP